MSGRSTTARCRWRLPAEPAVLPLVRASVTHLVADVDQGDLERIRLAVTEACANVVRHAYPGGPGMLDVAVCLSLTTIRVEVGDCGIGVADEHGLPEPHEGGGGLGLPLINMLADRVEIAPRQPGTWVRMTFELH